MKAALGVSYGHHESSACLLCADGSWEVVREEALSRIRGDHRFPIRSIEYLLASRSISRREIEVVCLHEKPLRNWLAHGFIKGQSPEHYLLKAQHLRHGNLSFQSLAKRWLGTPASRVHYSSHYASHYLTARAFLDNEQPHLALILDGYGEGLSGALFFGEGGEWEMLETFSVQQSLGLLYSALTSWVGYTSNSDEHKVMALSAYGEPRFYDLIRESVIVNEGSSFSVSSRFFNFEDYAQDAFTPEFCRVFGGPQAKKVLEDLGSKQARHVANVVASFQKVIEAVVCELAERMLEKYPRAETLLLGGGLFLNVKLVSELFERVHRRVLVSPTPGDAGSSIGAASFASDLLGWPFRVASSAFCGPVLQSLSGFPHLFQPFKVVDQSGLMLERLNDGQVCAVFQGRAECGPRSLGVRSLLCSIEKPEHIRRLNQVVKRREQFRPIAPMLMNPVTTPSSCSIRSRFEIGRWMGTLFEPTALLTNDFERFHHVMHADGSMRTQIVTDQDVMDGAFHSSLETLLDSGMILANTSLNIAGDPTVLTPLDLYVNLRRLGIAEVFADDTVYKVQ